MAKRIYVMRKRKRSVENSSNPDQIKEVENRDLPDLSYLFPSVIERDRIKTEIITSYIMDIELKELKRTIILYLDHLFDICEKKIVFKFKLCLIHILYKYLLVYYILF